MSKCMHNVQITEFCVSESCKYPTSGGCSRCFKEQHRHEDSSQHIKTLSLQEVQKLMSQYTFPSKVKPECVNVQESFYTFFKKLQMQLKEIIAIVDEICKNVVNTIGFPYICYNSYFTVFKRIKNRQYNRIPKKQFNNFINGSRNVSLSKLAEMQQKLYLKQINTSHEMIKQIDHLISSFENVTKFYDHKAKFVHDNSEYLRNKQLIQKIKLQLKNSSISNHKNNEPIVQKQRSKTFKSTWNNNNIRLSQGTNLQRSRVNGSVYENGGSVSTANVGHVQGVVKNVHGTPQRNKQAQSFGAKRQEKNLNTSITDDISQETVLKVNKRQPFLKQVYKSKQKQRKRTVSIDNHIRSSIKDRLKIKVQTVTKKKQRKEDNNINNSQWQKGSDESDRQQKQKIPINNLPLPTEEQKNKISKGNHQFEIRPIVRQLQERIYPREGGGEEQASSPLLKNKLRTQKMNKFKSNFNGDKNTHNHEPSNGNVNEVKGNRKVGATQSGQNILSEEEEKSFMMLVASLKLPIEQAIPLLQKALQQCQQNLSAVEYLSFLYIQAEFFDKCIKLCNKYLSMIWQNKDLYSSKVLLINNKASAFNQLGRYSETVKMLENYRSSNIAVYKNLANAYLGLGRHTQAIELYSKILNECSDEQIMFNLASCFYLIQDYDNAILKVEEALSLNPSREEFIQLKNHIVGQMSSKKMDQNF